ncbi:MAG: hypothetical protein JWR13_4850, partial [Mycobacterium sp.]|nr:hypothetical protein [Mycobacterium sp.]
MDDTPPHDHDDDLAARNLHAPGLESDVSALDALVGTAVDVDVSAGDEEAVGPTYTVTN